MNIIKYLSPVLILASFMSISLSALAQKAKIGLQVGAGVSNTHIRGDVDLASYQYLPSFDLATSGEYQLGNSPFSVRTELGFAFRGYQQAEGFMVPVEFRMMYINLPMTIQYRPKGRKFSIQAGPELGYLVWENINDNPINPIVGGINNPFELMVLLGVNYHVNNRIALGARGNYALSPSRSVELTDDIGASLGISTFHNYNMQLYARYDIGGF